MGDQGDRKTVRAFQCRDYLFEIFDRMGKEQECSVDYLINEAMREYARAREESVAAVDARPQEIAGTAVAGAAPIGRAPMGARPSPMLTPVPSRRPTVQPVQPAVHQAVTVPPPLPGHRPSDVGTRRVLLLQFNGEEFPVEKEEFIIGRGAKSADLAIRDGNISRKHAAVVFHDGAYFMKDLGSTNGIEFAGQRVESKRIEEGDVYRICDYELRFTYQ
ncbi:MAG: FHA domain-containing protein [Polyangiales bacterium]